jgi:hypothetical protein
LGSVFLERLAGGIAFEKDVVAFVVELAVRDEGERRCDAAYEDHYPGRSARITQLRSAYGRVG